MTNPTKPETRYIVRLQPELYQKLETKLSRTVVTSSTSAIEVGYQLGQAQYLIAAFAIGVVVTRIATAVVAWLAWRSA